eukprot:365381-Chlamydomonas_euryale.AAC.30
MHASTPALVRSLARRDEIKWLKKQHDHLSAEFERKKKRAFEVRPAFCCACGANGLHVLLPGFKSAGHLALALLPLLFPSPPTL